MIKWIKENWKDPVWSKVFAGIILSMLGGLGVLVTSFVKQIPVEELYKKSTTSYIHISYFSLTVGTIIVLAILLPAIYMDVVRVQLKDIKFPKKFRTSNFDLQQFLVGRWHCVYTHQRPNASGQEFATFENGNQYYIDGKLIFILTDIEFNEKDKEIKWTKTRYETGQKHSRETMKIKDENTISGTDDIGFTTIYTRTKNT